MFNLRQLNDKIFLLEFDDHTQMGKTCWRISEMYESIFMNDPYFTLEEYKQKYIDFFNIEEFSYYEDWSGFNFTAAEINKIDWNRIRDFGPYDQFMFNVVKLIRASVGYDCDYSLISCVKNETTVLYHELAHSFFCLYGDYKEHMLKLVNNVDEEKITVAKKCLMSESYRENLLDDEIQAYFSTGLSDKLFVEFKENDIKTSILTPFRKYYRSYRIKKLGLLTV